jgi:hypothetical protein
MKISIFDRTLCAGYKFSADEESAIVAGLIAAGVRYIEIPSRGFIASAPPFGGYVFGEEYAALNPVRVKDLRELEQLDESLSDSQNAIAASVLAGCGFAEKHIPTELALLHIGKSNDTDIAYDLIYDYIKPRLNQRWGYDGICALAAECSADYEYITYFYGKGLRAGNIRRILGGADALRLAEFDGAFAKELLGQC